MNSYEFYFKIYKKFPKIQGLIAYLLGVLFGKMNIILFISLLEALRKKPGFQLKITCTLNSVEGKNPIRDVL